MPNWLPVGVVEDEDFITIDNADAFVFKFRKGAAGYNEIWLMGEQFVADERWNLEYLQASNWKQRGIPQNVSWERLESYSVVVKRSYRDWGSPETTFNVSYHFLGGFMCKIAFEGYIGQEDEYRIVWSVSGINKEFVQDDEANHCVNFWNSGDEDTVGFDYSDVYQHFGNITDTQVEVSAGNHKLDEVFYVNVLAVGDFMLDPGIGFTSKGQYNSDNTDRIEGSDWTMSENGTADSITVYLQQYSILTPKIKCGIYYANKTFVGGTEEWTLTAGWDNWKTFNFASGPSLYSGLTYTFVFWSDEYVRFFFEVEHVGRYKAEVYDGWPNPIASWTTTTRKLSLYCNYTSAGANNAPTVGSFTISNNTVYANTYALLNCTVNDADGVSDFANTTLELNGSIVLKWLNSTDTFSIHSDTNSYCSLDASNSSSTALNGTAYRLSWRVKLYWNYTEGLIDVINATVYDDEPESGSGSHADLFTFENDLIVASATYSPDKPVIEQEFLITGQLYYTGTSISPEDGSGITVYAQNQTTSNTTTVTNGAFSITVTAPSTEGSYNWLTYSNTSGGISEQNQTVTVYIHPAGQSPPSNGFHPVVVPSQVNFYGSALSLGLLSQGQQMHFDLTVQWTGANEIIIKNMTMSGLDTSWILAPSNQYFPMHFFRSIGETNGTAKIAILMQVPLDASPKDYQLGFTLTVEAITTETQVSCRTTFSVQAAVIPTQPIQDIVGILLVVCVGVIIFGAVVKKRKGRP